MTEKLKKPRAKKTTITTNALDKAESLKPKKTATGERAGIVAMTVNGTEPKKTARKATPKVTGIKVSHEEIARLAHRFWNERGRVHGHDAEDWLRAERQLLGKAS